ncbi:MAG: metallophosphoesterase [Actinomycetales bacterium]|nr:metallophosphoesterase [Actinomycetales bacterium]
MRLRSGLTAGVLTGAAATAMAVVATRDFRLRQRTVPVLRDPAVGPLRILHLSDLHLRPSHRRLPEWLRGLRGLQPNLVVVTGDIIGHPGAIDAAYRALSPFLDVPGIVVGGSHDYFPPDWHNPVRYLTEGPSRRAHDGPEMPWRDLRDRVQETGWAWPINDWVECEVAGHAVRAFGTDDAHIDRDDCTMLQQPPTGQLAILQLGVTHAPYRRVLDALTQAHCELILAGHTHGGQVCWPDGSAIVANCDVPLNLARGLGTYLTPEGQRSWLHVSAGLGTSPFTPVRVFCAPEATLLTVI